MFESLWGWLKDVHLLALCSTKNLQVSIKFSGLKIILSISNKKENISEQTRHRILGLAFNSLKFSF